MFGYSSENYLKSLSHAGVIQRLPDCGGHVLVRDISRSNLSEAVGMYPFFCCKNWNKLSGDIDQLSGIVSLCLVTDPFGDFETDTLKSCFPDVMYQFKCHYVVDLRDDLSQFVSGHHQRNARKALRSVTVREVDNSGDFVATWTSLYENLKRRHRISGIAEFSETSFELQLRVPGVRVFEAVHGSDRLGAVIWYLDGSRAYYHLGAWTDQGYEMRASFAVFWESLTRFRDEGILSVGLGAGSGAEERSDGLTRFKSGWSNRRKPVYFCGRIVDHDSYHQLTSTNSRSTNEPFFPAYRSPERR